MRDVVPIRAPLGPEPEPEPISTMSWTGQVVADRYRILQPLGEGAMGAVFQAQHVRMGKVLALKLLHRALAREPVARERFRAEAQIVSRLSHPHTIAVFDFGELGPDGFYLAMEYVPGEDLRRLLAHGPIGEARAIAIVEQVLGSLAEAHAVGIVHRDVKPANVMVVEGREGDFVKLLDFGIAQLRDVAGAAAARGAVLGTAAYLAPEQARGSEVDVRADLYAAGALLYELAAGRPPFQGSTAEVLAAHVRLAPPPLGELTQVSRGFAAVVHRALAKRPEDRFPSAEAMRSALLALRARPVLRPEPTWTWSGPRADDGRRAALLPAELASREDFASLEHRRRALFPRWLVAPAIAAALLVAASLAYWRRDDLYLLVAPRAPSVAAALAVAIPLRGQEHEPNDTAETANVLALPPLGLRASGLYLGGAGVVRGTLSATGSSQADVDVFRLEVPESARPIVLVAEWSAERRPETGLQGIVAKLALHRAPAAGSATHEAALVAQVQRGPGEPLRLVSLALPGSYYLSVRAETDARRADEPDEPYVLRVWIDEPTTAETRDGQRGGGGE